MQTHDKKDGKSLTFRAILLTICLIIFFVAIVDFFAYPRNLVNLYGILDPKQTAFMTLLIEVLLGFILASLAYLVYLDEQKITKLEKQMSKSV